MTLHALSRYMYLYLDIVCYDLLCLAIFCYDFAMHCYTLLFFCYDLLCFCYVSAIFRYVPLFTFRVATE